MPARDDNHWKLKPHLYTFDGLDWGEVVAYFQAEEAKGLKQIGVFEDGTPCYEGVANVRLVEDEFYGGLALRWWHGKNYILGGYREHQRFAHQNECKLCRRKMAGHGVKGVCAHCKLAEEREKAAMRSRRYRTRNGLTKAPGVTRCQHCGNTFTPKRSTAKFCSDKCRIASHRANKVTPPK